MSDARKRNSEIITRERLGRVLAYASFVVMKHGAVHTPPSDGAEHGRLPFCHRDRLGSPDLGRKFALRLVS